MKHFMIIAGLLFCLSGCSTTSDFMQGWYRDKKIDGTIIISAFDGTEEYIYNRSRAAESYLPASTFKIVNTLLALEEGAVQDIDEIIPWDGTDRGVPEWNKDQSLRTAFPESCVWFYQRLAQRIGNTAYLKWLKIFGYGNRRTGSELTTFWLDGDLRISPLNQIDVLKKIYRESYPIKKENYDILKTIMLVDKSDTYRLYAKTGWVQRAEPQIGWYAGYVETNDRVWFFVSNLTINSNADAAFRKESVYAALKNLNIIK